MANSYSSLFIHTIFRTHGRESNTTRGMSGDESAVPMGRVWSLYIFRRLREPAYNDSVRQKRKDDDRLGPDL